MLRYLVSALSNPDHCCPVGQNKVFKTIFKRTETSIQNVLVIDTLLWIYLNPRALPTIFSFRKCAICDHCSQCVTYILTFPKMQSCKNIHWHQMGVLLTLRSTCLSCILVDVLRDTPCPYIARYTKTVYIWAHIWTYQMRLRGVSSRKDHPSYSSEFRRIQLVGIGGYQHCPSKERTHTHTYCTRRLSFSHNNHRKNHLHESTKTSK